MSAAPAQAKPQKPKKEKDKERDKERKGSLQPQNERLKTVVRRLPANLPEEIFWQSVQQWVTNETAVWKSYCPGKLRKKLNKENIPSRAYIAFKEAEQLAVFSREYDGHVFRDKSGVESQAVVEFAPYPKIPSEKRKPDPRNGTIEKDEDYMSFLETLKAAENQGPVTLESLIASSQPAPPPKTTPLLEALKAEKSANKDKEAILRNHAHYNNMNVTALRKDEKKKAAASSAPPKADAKGAGSSAPAQASGKKAKKAQANADAATTSAQATKNAQQQGASAANAKNATANASASGTQPAKPAKPSRPPRGANKAAAAAAAAAANANGAVATNPPTILTANHVAPTSSAAANNNATVSAPAAAGGGGGGGGGRRVRPVIGLASRQFEAALSGVSGLASAATERKRRERERDGGAGSGSGSNLNGINGASVPPTPTSAVTYARIDGSDNEKPTPSAKANPPASPKRERTRRGGRGGGGGGGGGGSGGPTTTAANSPQVKVPSILQRVAEPSQKNTAEGASNAVPAGGAVQQNGTPSGAGENASGAGGGRGGRRGRGGGRGRGGTAPANANAPRGG